jgi:hypothetical protein
MDVTGSEMASCRVDLGRLLQDQVVVEPESPGHLDGQRDAHGGDRHDHVGLVGGQELGQLRAGLLGEAHPVVNGDEQGDGQVVGDGDQRADRRPARLSES